MNIKRRSVNILLTLLILVLGGTAVGIWRLSPRSHSQEERRTSFGVFENRQLVELAGASGERTYIVEDASGRFVFTIPLRNSIIDCRFRNGMLRFHDRESGKEGYFDSAGYMKFGDTLRNDMLASHELEPDTVVIVERVAVSSPVSTSRFKDVDIRGMSANHPFSVEARRVLSGDLSVTDSLSRRKILSYCEHFRTAYTTKDIDFLRQVFSENALIIVGNTVKTGGRGGNGMMAEDKVTYSIRSKEDYLKKLTAVFNSNKDIDLKFSEFNIMRHPTIDGIYGVSLRQAYHSDRYSDDGYLFLLWDFRDRSMPLIHVRTWQPESVVRNGEEITEIGDFNLD